MNIKNAYRKRRSSAGDHHLEHFIKKLTPVLGEVFDKLDSGKADTVVIAASFDGKPVVVEISYLAFDNQKRDVSVEMIAEEWQRQTDKILIGLSEMTGLPPKAVQSTLHDWLFPLQPLESLIETKATEEIPTSDDDEFLDGPSGLSETDVK